VNSIKLSVVIAYGLLAIWPGLSVHAAPAVNSTPVEAVGDVAKWNKLNRRFFEAMVNASTTIPNGAWSDTGAAIWYTETGGNFLQKTLSTTPAGPSESTKTVTLDPAKGTITEVSGPVTRVRRVTSEQAHVFTVETLSVSGPDSDGFNTPTLNIRVTPEVIEVSELSGKQVARYVWSSRADAMKASTAARGATSAISKPEMDAKISRWGLVGKMMGRQFVHYSPGNDILWDHTSGYEWIVPGEHARSYAIGPDGQKQSAGELRWNSQTNRMDLINPQGEVWGYETANADGTLSTVIGEATGRTVEQSDGSLRSEGHSPANGSYTSIAYENTPEGKRLAYQAWLRDQDAADAAAAAASEARQAEHRENTARFMSAMSATQQALEAADEVATAHEAESRAEMDASVSAPATQPRDTGAGDAADQPTPSQSVSAERAVTEGKALRFVMAIGLDTRAGDSVNPTCYSNVVTRPGPPGWGGGGFLPDSSSEQAHEAVQSLKSSFIAACQSASGRNVTNENNFRWGWNETPDTEERLNKMHAGYPEDVTVNVN
jgi:hypothetical protein